MAVPIARMIWQRRVHLQQWPDGFSCHRCHHLCCHQGHEWRSLVLCWELPPPPIHAVWGSQTFWCSKLGGCDTRAEAALVKFSLVPRTVCKLKRFHPKSEQKRWNPFILYSVGIPRKYSCFHSLCPPSISFSFTPPLLCTSPVPHYSLLSVFCFFVFSCLEMESLVAQAVHQLPILLAPPPKPWHYWPVSPRLSSSTSWCDSCIKNVLFVTW